MTRRLYLVALLIAALAASGTAPAAAQAPGEVSILHTSPADVTPGLQIYLTAVLRNATSGVVAWNNGTLAVDAIAPMTNLSANQEGGWLYAAWLPAQADGTRVTYAIRASGPAGDASENYFVVITSPSTPGITQADQDAWILTVAASLAMPVSVIVVIYWYTRRRLLREGV